MANVRSEDLALQYVLTDESAQEQAISEKAAISIEQSTNSRLAVGKLVASINRWIHTDNDASDDDNFIERAKALDFLASTLGVLKQRNPSYLNADLIQLLVNFFGSLFSSDHRGGVTASAKALRHLVSMKSFQPNVGDRIITNICKLGDDFKLQTPSTRLELYELVLGLIQDPAVASHLEDRHGNTCSFMIDLIDLCKNERDPQNLMKWFETLKTFLQSFSPSEDVTSEVFKAFSAYFPISLRASASPSGVTADDLKRAVRSCFAAHYRLATHSIPYLIAKLDQGHAVTVAVKVDILQTLDACVSQYEKPQESLAPFADQIWSLLKYEVRNGEAADTVEATLKVIGSLTTRLDGDELRSFLANAWRDLSEDLPSPGYTVPAGQLLVAISGASAQSFVFITSRAVPNIRTTLEHTQSGSHKQELVAILNSFLRIRQDLIYNLKVDTSVDNEIGLLNDELFGDSLFDQVYLPFLDANQHGPITDETLVILKKVLEGLVASMIQQTSGPDVSDRFVTWLAVKTIDNPFGFQGERHDETSSIGDKSEDLRDAAVEALRSVVLIHPEVFKHLLRRYLCVIREEKQKSPRKHELVAASLCDICCSSLRLPSGQLSALNSILYISALLNVLLCVLAESAPEYATPSFAWTYIHIIRLSISKFLSFLSKQTLESPPTKLEGISKEWYVQFVNSLENARVLRIGLNLGGQQLDLSYESPETQMVLMGQALKGPLETNESSPHQQMLAHALSVVQQLYRRFTTLKYQAHGGNSRSHVGLTNVYTVVAAHGASNEFRVSQQELCLHELGLLAASVVSALSANEQKALELGKEAFALFQNTNPGNDGAQRDLPLEFDGLSLVGEFVNDDRTAPLSMGVLQGLYPGVVSSVHHVEALKNLCAFLTSAPLPCSDATRASLDAALTTLSNKLQVQYSENDKEMIQIQEDLMNTTTKIWDDFSEGKLNVPTTVRIFRSILHFLAGDVARFQSTGVTHNLLLKLICDEAPSKPVIGRQLARQFGVLVSPKECLEKESHAIVKKLSGGWLYSNAVRPYLKECFPSSDVATHRAVAVFAVLKHLKYEQYASDIEEIGRIGICSLSTFEPDAETDSCLHVLLQILDKNPEALKDHISGLISGAIAVLREAAKAKADPEGFESSEVRQEKRAVCRKLALELLRQLPKSYEAQLLRQYCFQLRRPLSAACGDLVRDIRRTALMARMAWDALS
ncbi:Dos2-interacting transcription regulator of RNA-Pol-II-domain-containing protein [Hypoxylon sp. NC1633]|nr:Dos2-interacting transcription regulator of RNA-Pol-II-domain-containing protein [Hypoxylon sp. NC1633]